MREISCGFIIVNNNKKVLLGKTNSGNYTVFKGKQEKNETFLDTAIRELSEESGIDINILPQLKEYISTEPVFEYHLKNKDVFLFLLEDNLGLLKDFRFKCKSTYGKSEKNLEILGYKWVKIKDMSKHIFPSQKGIKKYLENRYNTKKR
jgi:8-oxo-dGTP pyrophosphatase MutT (NUDIX family)